MKLSFYSKLHIAAGYFASRLEALRDWAGARAGQANLDEINSRRARKDFLFS